MDIFAYERDSVSNPARASFTIVPQDGVELSLATKAIYVGTGGDLTLRCLADETATTLRNVGDGAILPLRVVEVLATGTTAGDLVGLN